jgi:uncharacterized protein (TIGR03546 family)
MLKPIIKLLTALNGNVKKGQIAAGFAWGLLLALVPAFTFFWIVLLVFSFCFRHNHGSKLVVMAVLKIFMALVYPLVDTLGWGILHLEPLQPFFTRLYNMPFVPLTGFNNTLVAGGLTAGLALWLPVYFFVSALIPVYRSKLAPRIRNSRVVKFITKLPFVSALEKAAAAAVKK